MLSILTDFSPRSCGCHSQRASQMLKNTDLKVISSSTRAKSTIRRPVLSTLFEYLQNLGNRKSVGFWPIALPDTRSLRTQRWKLEHGQLRL